MMNASTRRSEHAHDLRQPAEKLVRLTRCDVAALPVDDVQNLVHELQVYQIQHKTTLCHARNFCD